MYNVRNSGVHIFICVCIMPTGKICFTDPRHNKLLILKEFANEGWRGGIAS